MGKPIIYDQHAAAFAQVSAWVILRDGERVATIAMKYPRDGAGRLYAYVHWLATEMVRGWAGGGGYDKRSAACASAARHWADAERKAVGAYSADATPKYAFWAALAEDGGYSWDHMLREAGFAVLQAV